MYESISESATDVVWGFSSAVLVRTGVAATGPSEADLLTEEEEDCIDWERCLFRLVDPVSDSLFCGKGDAAGDGKFMTFGRLKDSKPPRRVTRCNVTVTRVTIFEP